MQTRPDLEEEEEEVGPCARDMWAVPLQARNAYHVEVETEMHRTAATPAAGTTQ